MRQAAPTFLIVEDLEQHRKWVASVLREEFPGAVIESVEDVDSAKVRLPAFEGDVVILDHQLLKGRNILDFVLEAEMEVPVIEFTEYLKEIEETLHNSETLFPFFYIEKPESFNVRTDPQGKASQERCRKVLVQSARAAIKYRALCRKLVAAQQEIDKCAMQIESAHATIKDKDEIIRRFDYSEGLVRKKEVTVTRRVEDAPRNVGGVWTRVVEMFISILRLESVPEPYRLLAVIVILSIIVLGAFVLRDVAGVWRGASQ